MSWVTKKVSDFADVVTGGTPSTSNSDYWTNGTIPWLPSGACQNCVINSADTFITELGLRESAAKMMPPDTVVIALTGATTGKVGLLAIDACANQSVTGILPNDTYSSMYLFHYLQSIRDKVIGDSYGGAQKHISQGYVKSMEILFPPLDIQRRIAAMLDKAQSLIAARREQIAVLDKLSKDLFIDMFGDPEANTKDWQWITIRELVSEVKYGTSKPATVDGRYVYLRMNNITYDGYMDYSSLKYIDLTEAEYEKYCVVSGDVLFNRTNSKELVGKTAVYYGDTPTVIAGYIIRIRTNERAIPEFLSGFLNTRYSKITLTDMCKAIVGQANINAQELQNIKIYAPPIELQKSYAERITAINRQKTRIIKSLTELETLYKSLTQRAFAGELFT